ncbi:MAG: DUF3179 domain-containing protein [Planctomycetes bacterium]|nr:DUF3179 domain-containing protein [Planctomycetota bacterium]
MVYGRMHENEIDEFGVSGYVYRNVFLTYDRRTQSLWYPLDDKMWTAISGPRKGETIPIESHPEVTTLGAWRTAHPDTVVLLGSRDAHEIANEPE